MYYIYGYTRYIAFQSGQNNQRASEASELSPCSCQLRFQIYVYMRRTYVDLYAHAQEIIAKKRP